jgi:hypothetical protein
MKMLTIICREGFKDVVLNIFATQGITGYTVIRGAGGAASRVLSLLGLSAGRIATCCFLLPSTMIRWPHW